MIKRPPIRLANIASAIKAGFSRLRRPRRAGAVTPIKGGRVFLTIRTDKMQQAYELKEDGAVPLHIDHEYPKTDVTFIVVDDHRQPADRRYVMEPKTSRRAMREQILLEFGEHARLLQSSDDDRIVYARALTSFAEYDGARLLPGHAIVDHLITPASSVSEVLPIVLKDAQGTVLSLLIYSVKADPVTGRTRISDLQVTNRPTTDVMQIVVRYAQEKKIEILSDLKAPDTGALFKLAHELPVYRTEPDIAGIPLSTMLKGACVGSGVLAAASLAGNLVFAAEAGYLRISAEDATAQRDAVSGQVTELLTQRIRTVLVALSVDEHAAIEAAKSAWVPNARTEIACNRDRCTLSLIGSMNYTYKAAGGESTGQLISPVVDEAVTRSLLTQAPPKGFKKKDVLISGNGNAISVIFEQQKSDSSLRGLLPH